MVFELLAWSREVTLPSRIWDANTVAFRRNRLTNRNAGPHKTLQSELTLFALYGKSYIFVQSIALLTETPLVITANICVEIHHHYHEYFLAMSDIRGTPQLDIVGESSRSTMKQFWKCEIPLHSGLYHCRSGSHIVHGQHK